MRHTGAGDVNPGSSWTPPAAIGGLPAGQDLVGFVSGAKAYAVTTSSTREHDSSAVRPVAFRLAQRPAVVDRRDPFTAALATSGEARGSRPELRARVTVRLRPRSGKARTAVFTLEAPVAIC